MEMKRKPLHLRHKAMFEQELKDRLSYLAGKGIKPPKADKDPIVKKLKAEVKAVDRRLKLVAEHEKRSEEMAKIKAERAAAPKKEEAPAKAEKPKKAPAGKEKKKTEKKPAPPKAPEGEKA